MLPYRVGVRWVWLKGAGGGNGNEYEEVLVAVWLGHDLKTISKQKQFHESSGSIK